MTMIFDLESQSHILFSMVDPVGVNVKIISPQPTLFARYRYVSAFHNVMDIESQGYIFPLG